MRPIGKLAALAMTFSLWWAAGASAATLHLLGSFDQPIFITSNPANPNDLLVVEREGRVVQVEGGTVRLFADLTALVSCCEDERGLLSIAPAPDFSASGRFYAAYTGNGAAGGAEGDIHVDAFRRGSGGLLREPILDIGHATFANHNGGQLQLGPDGHLYVSTGDGGGGGDPFGSGQSLETLLGKILRIEPHPGAVPEIWSYGLRNPWRFSFDRVNGDMVIGDVGQDEREEIDFAPSPAAGVVGAGANYGWNCREGLIAYVEAPSSCDGVTGFTDPVFEYPHADPGGGKAHGCAITGGYVVRDPSLGDLYGRYVYADFCAGEIRSLALPSGGGPATKDRSEGLNLPSPISFGEDACGRLYVISNDGTVYRLEGTAPASCLAPPPAAVGAGSQSSLPAPKRGPVRVHLGATTRYAGDQVKLTLSVHVSPCAEQAGSWVRLNRGGRPIATKRLDRSCSARFRIQIAHRSTFRALLPSTGYRSQVRTIALAKPSP